MNERIIIRHLNFGKANQTEEFPVKMFKELTVGRESNCEIKFDPERDDLVSRRHAKITIDKTDPVEFSIQDLQSRNGTFVNKQRISSSVKLMPGDVVQLGAGGPEFQFDVEPRPANLRPTRLANEGPPVILPPTKEAPAGFGAGASMGAGTAGVGAAFGAGSAPAYGSQGMPQTAPQPHTGTVGKATVERMIGQTKTQTRTQMLLLGLVLFVIIAAVGGYFLWQSKKPTVDTVAQNKIDVVNRKLAEQDEIMSPRQIAEKYRDSVVLMEVSWKLVDVATGQQLNQVYVNNNVKDKNGKDSQLIPNAPAQLPVFFTYEGQLEPVLSTAEEYGKHAIGETGSGSGFVVSADGFILTNRHVAAGWYTSYDWPDQVGLEIAIDSKTGTFVAKQPLMNSQFPHRWVPADAKVVIEGPFALSNARVKQKPLMGKAIEGRNTYCDVTFANNRIRIPGSLARNSDRIDVAMVKISLPRTVKETRLYDNYNMVKQGEAVTVMGYPGVSPEVVAVTGSKDVFNRHTNETVIPDPTISNGIIQRVLRDGEINSAGEGTYSIFGDVYQLSINSTGQGNSGGPVFDDHGRVIGIFTSTRQAAGASVTFAVPIKYGMELMGVTSSSK